MEDQGDQLSVHDLPWEGWTHILSYLSVEDLVSCSRTCTYLRDISLDPMLWREFLRRDYSDFNGAIGLDLVRQQENSLTQSQTIAHSDWAEAPWQEYYKLAFQASHIRSLVWVNRYIANMEARQDHAGARCGDYLVVYAGFTRDRSLYVLDTCAQLEQIRTIVKQPNTSLDEAIVAWHRCEITGEGPQLYGILYGHSLVTLDHSSLLLYGGMQAPGYRFESGETWLLHLIEQDNTEVDPVQTKQETPVAPFRWKWEPTPIRGITPPPRAYHSAVVSHGKFWIFGGTWGGVTHDDFWVLDLTTWTWTDLSHVRDHPSSRMGHSCCAHGSELFLFGGSESPYCQGPGDDFSDAYAFNMISSTWRKLPDCPGRYIGRRHASVLLGHRVLVIGGSNPHTNDIACFDLSTEQWTVPSVIGMKPSPRVGLTAHYCNGLIYVFGGCTDHGLSKQLFILDPSDFTGALQYQRIDPQVQQEQEFRSNSPGRFLIGGDALRQLLLGLRGGLAVFGEEDSDEFEFMDEF